MAQPKRQLRTLERGILCLVIGVAVLLGPRFLQGTRWFAMPSTNANQPTR